MKMLYDEPDFIKLNQNFSEDNFVIMLEVLSVLLLKFLVQIKGWNEKALIKSGL